jgi:hypothetical protein
VRIFSDTLGWTEIRNAMADTRPETSEVTMDLNEVTLNGRRRRMTYDVSLEGTGPRHTHHKNTGNQGGGTGDMAATWMDWGWLIAVMFRYEPTAVIGQYDGRADFIKQTTAMIPHRLRIDASVRNFSTRYAAWWHNPNNADWKDTHAITSPFLLVDRICPPRELITLHPPEALEAWLDSGRDAG